MSSSRLGFIDTVRGLILVLMALDHTSVFWNRGRVAWEGLPIFRDGVLTFNFPQTASLAQYFTRFLTHICAPGFIFMAGMMVALASARRDVDPEGRRRYSTYLARRGLLFILLEVSFIQLIWGYNMFLYPPAGGEDFIVIGFGIISLFGFLFLILSFARDLPSVPMLLFSLAVLLVYIIVFPSLSLATYRTQSSLLLNIAPLLYLPIEFGERSIVTGIYPIFPWISVMLFGILFGRLLHTLEEGRKLETLMRYSLLFGAGLIMLCVLYEALTSARLSKYPPSLGFLSMTLGAVLMLLGIAQLSEEKGIACGILRTFGRVPFFFYVTHLLLYSLVPSLTGTYAGFSLATTYVAWLCGLPILFFLCRWYYGFKMRHRDSFLKYI